MLYKKKNISLIFQALMALVHINTKISIAIMQKDFGISMDFIILLNILMEKM